MLVNGNKSENLYKRIGSYFHRSLSEKEQCINCRLWCSLSSLQLLDGTVRRRCWKSEISCTSKIITQGVLGLRFVGHTFWTVTQHNIQIEKPRFIGKEIKINCKYYKTGKYHMQYKSWENYTMFDYLSDVSFVLLSFLLLWWNLPDPPPQKKRKNCLAENGFFSLQFYHCGKVKTGTQVIVTSYFSQEQRETKTIVCLVSLY